MLIKTPAIIQGETEKGFYTRVNGGVCIGTAYGKRYSIDIGNQDLQVHLRGTITFISDEMLYEDQQKITDENIARAIDRLGIDYLSDHDRENE